MLLTYFIMLVVRILSFSLIWLIRNLCKVKMHIGLYLTVFGLIRSVVVQAMRISLLGLLVEFISSAVISCGIMLFFLCTVLL
jgi:hypothetical protein